MKVSGVETREESGFREATWIADEGALPELTLCFHDNSCVVVDERVRILPCRTCLLYTSPSPRDRQKSRMPSSA